MDTRRGRIVADAKAANVNGNTVMNFTLAVNRDYKSKKTGEWVKQTEYIECAAWNKPELAPQFLKGIEVEIEGRIGVRAYVNKEQEPVGVMTLLMLNHDFLKGNKGAQGANASAPAAAPAGAGITEPLDDLPF